MTTTLNSEFLFALQVKVGKPQVFGDTPLGGKRFAPIVGGTFAGPRLRGVIEEGGADWIRVRRDAVRQIDVRISLRSHDECLIAMSYQGYRLAEPEVLERERNGIETDPADYAYRVTAFFECGDPRYDWLNRVVAVGIGTRKPPAGPVYDVFAVR